LKRKLLAILAVVPALFLPLAATSQIIHERGAAPAEKSAPTYKYEISAGYGYTSLNQVDNSKNGLQGVDLSITRDWGKFFGIIADGGVYKYPYDATNPGNPSVDSVLFGPVFHANLYGRFDGFVRVLVGGEHTAGENATPKVSFAGGYGAGLDYKLSPRFFIRASGDDILSSFLANANPSLCPSSADCSANMRKNSRAAFAVVYKF
jgi:hypothetical protein